MFLRKKAHNLFAKSMKLALKNTPRSVYKTIEEEEVTEEAKPRKTQKIKKDVAEQQD